MVWHRDPERPNPRQISRERRSIILIPTRSLPCVFVDLRELGFVVESFFFFLFFVCSKWKLNFVGFPSTLLACLTQPSGLFPLHCTNVCAKCDRISINPHKAETLHRDDLLSVIEINFTRVLNIVRQFNPLIQIPTRLINPISLYVQFTPGKWSSRINSNVSLQ